jgi:hypothetical protein
LDRRPFRERYYAIIGSVALVFCVLRLMREDYGIAAALAIVAAALFIAAAVDRT